MDSESIRNIYDAEYAASYNSKFINNISAQDKLKAELKILSKLFELRESQVNWLDLGCGTGYFLKQFPDISRAGLDISPAMVSEAQKNNPGIPIFTGDFSNRDLFQQSEWEAISSMWWAYSYLSTLSEIEVFIQNVSYWLTDTGIFFLPVANLQNFTHFTKYSKSTLPYKITVNAPGLGGEIFITAFQWSYIEENGKCHENLIVPQIEYLIDLFGKYFKNVTLISYTPYYQGIIASKSDLDLDFLHEISGTNETVQKPTSSRLNRRRVILNRLNKLLKKLMLLE